MTAHLAKFTSSAAYEYKRRQSPQAGEKISPGFGADLFLAPCGTAAEQTTGMPP